MTRVEDRVADLKQEPVVYRHEEPRLHQRWIFLWKRQHPYARKTAREWCQNYNECRYDALYRLTENELQAWKNGRPNRTTLNLSVHVIQMIAVWTLSAEHNRIFSSARWLLKARFGIWQIYCSGPKNTAFSGIIKTMPTQNVFIELSHRTLQTEKLVQNIGRGPKKNTVTDGTTAFGLVNP